MKKFIFMLFLFPSMAYAFPVTRLLETCGDGTQFFIEYDDATMTLNQIYPVPLATKLTKKYPASFWGTGQSVLPSQDLDSVTKYVAPKGVSTKVPITIDKQGRIDGVEGNIQCIAD